MIIQIEFNNNTFDTTLENYVHGVFTKIKFENNHLKWQLSFYLMRAKTVLWRKSYTSPPITRCYLIKDWNCTRKSSSPANHSHAKSATKGNYRYHTYIHICDHKNICKGINSLLVGVYKYQKPSKHKRSQNYKN